MSDFERVRRAATNSWLIGRASRMADVLALAWPASVVGGALNRSAEQLARLAVADRVRWVATTIAIAALAHLALRATLPRTVVPAMPAMLIAGIAAFAAVVAWQADAFARAWRAR